MHNIVKEKIENAKNGDEVTDEEADILNDKNDHTWEEERISAQDNYDAANDPEGIDDSDDPEPDPDPASKPEQKIKPAPIGEAESSQDVVSAIRNNIQQFLSIPINNAKIISAQFQYCKSVIDSVAKAIKNQIRSGYESGNINKEDFDELSKEISEAYDKRMREFQTIRSSQN